MFGGISLAGTRPGRAIGNMAALLVDVSFIRSSGILFLGNSAARLLGLLFSIAAARLLSAADYGVLAYGLAVVGIASTFLYTAPGGLTRHLAFYHDNRGQQDAYFSNWVAVIGVLLAVTMLLTTAMASLAGFGMALIASLAVNLVGVAVLEGYMGAQRGLERYAAAVIFYIIANALQLVAIVVAGLVGWRSTTLFLTIYGLSSLGALALTRPALPLPLRFLPGALAWRRLVEVAKFMRPLLLATACYAVWFGADLIFLRRVASDELVGNYAAAKVLVSILQIAPAAVGGALVPRVAHLRIELVPQELLRVLALVGAVTIPLVIALSLLGRVIGAAVFGTKYPYLADPLPALSIGVGLYGVQLQLAYTCIALSRPAVYAVSMGITMMSTVSADFLLVPQHGLVGAAVALALGAALGLITASTLTVRTLREAGRP